MSTEQMVQSENKNFAYKKFYREDFSNQKLHHANFKCASCIECNFTNTDLRHADCEGANFFGSDFTGACLYRTNMKDAILEKTRFFPRDAFGLTITLKCETFADMELDRTWFYVWLFFPLLMKISDEARDKLIDFIGPDRYVKFKAILNRRVI